MLTSPRIWVIIHLKAMSELRGLRNRRCIWDCALRLRPRRTNIVLIVREVM